jgi:predicted nuclease of predicted toxin-antitoxin system
MKFLIDECVLGKTVRLLRKEGFSVTTIQELGKSSATNGTVINIANKQKAIIITNDLDFGNLILYPLGCHEGIIVLRPRLDTPEAVDDVHSVLIRLLKETKPTELEKSLIIVDRNKYRIKRTEE